MNNFNTATASVAEVKNYSLLDSIVEQSRIARNDQEHDRAKSLIGSDGRYDYSI